MVTSTPERKPSDDEQPWVRDEPAPEDRVGKSGIPRLPLLYVAEGFGPKPDE